ncbi:MAG TPA: A/G-specific adenine glycosylase, partial [Rhodospirillaceae bacterium]|nr:A/G-specific adenine glycosylase [Rhodospirillaceae bacterium]
ARFFAVEEPLPQSKKILKAFAAECLPAARFGDYAQALMDLGATVCTPRSPRCPLCPWSKGCLAREKGVEEALPVRQKMAKKPRRKAFLFVLSDKNGRILMQKRPDKGLLAGMMGLPVTPLNDSKPLAWDEALRYAPVLRKGWRLLDKVVHHTFTHFELELRVAVASTDRTDRKVASKVEGIWIARHDVPAQALPTVMRKALKTALEWQED